MNLAMNSDMKIGAESMKQLFDEFIKAGFTRKEALELIKTSLSGVKGS